MALTDRGSRRGSSLVMIAVATILAVETGCSSPTATPTDAPVSPSPSRTTQEWPVAMAAMGHSGLTGFDSGSGARDEPANSWATGTNPAVDSVYLRLVAANPAAEGNGRNFAVSGSNVDSLPFQVNLIKDMDPKPELILIQSIDNDMQCDGTDDANLPVYRDKLTQVLDTLTSVAPDADILFVSQPVDVQHYSDTIMAIDPTHLAGTGPCDVVDPTTLQLVPGKVDGLQALVDEYFDAIVQVCASYPRCRTDDGAMQRMDLDPGDLAPDMNHFSVTGQAKMAAIAWSVLYPGR